MRSTAHPSDCRSEQEETEKGACCHEVSEVLQAGLDFDNEDSQKTHDGSAEVVCVDLFLHTEGCIFGPEDWHDGTIERGRQQQADNRTRNA